MEREFYNMEDKSRNVIAASTGTGFVYSDIVPSNNATSGNIHHHHHHHHHQMVNHQIQVFEPNPSDDQIFRLNTNVGMIDFSKQHHHLITTGLEETSSENLLLDHDSSSLRCVSVFPCEGNERPSQGLSLSLSSSNPTSISLQSFELRQGTQPDHDHVRLVGSGSRQGYFGKSENIQQSQMINNYQFQIRSSKYLGPTQELLNEFCSLGTKESDEQIIEQKNQKNKQQWDNDIHDESASTSSRKQIPLNSHEFMDLQKRKTKLLTMLEELDRRYRHYCDQMGAAVSSFEDVAGVGSAAVYMALASKAMSRHFRCLRDGIVGQIQATRRTMGEKVPVAPGTTRGETPRLKLLDQAFRRQKAYQQMNMMESHPWRPQRGLPERAVSILRAWLFEHFLNPYPSDVDKHILARQTGLSRSQVSNWFINARVRLWKPMVEEMYLEETKEDQGNNINNYIASSSDHGVSDLRENDMANHQSSMIIDPKPEPNQLVRVEPESLSSIITNPNHKYYDPKTSSKPLMAIENQQHQGFGSAFDFSTYNHPAMTNADDSTNQGFNGGAGTVSLTLGLQQHGGSGGMSLALSPASHASLFYSREHIEDRQGVQYSLLDTDQGQNLPYRNLIGAQLLHDMV